MMNLRHSVIFFIIVYSFIKYSSDSAKNIYNTSDYTVDLDTSLNSLNIKVLGNHEGSASILIFEHLTHHKIDSIGITKGVLYQYITDDLNDDGTTDIILKFSDDKSAAYIILVHKDYYKLFKEYGDYVHNIEAISLNGNTEYATYRTFGCADAVWESELIEFRKDTILRLYRYEEDFCDLSKKQSVLIRFQEGDTLWMRVDSTVLIEKNLQSLWKKLIKE